MFHCFPKALPGGFVGVDIFFVISGYLITGILSREYFAKQFSIAHFYEKRIRRIFPALAIVLISTYVFGWEALYGPEYRALGTDRCAITYSAYQADMKGYYRMVARLQSAHPHMTVVDPSAALCDKAANKCRVVMNRHYLYSYGDHVSDYANGRMAKMILPALGLSVAQTRN